MISDSPSVERLVALWPGKLPEVERLTYLRLSADRQRMAIERLQAVRDYKSGAMNAAHVMARLNVKRSQFYKLLKDWGAKESLESLVPFAKPGKPRATRLKESQNDLIRKMLKDQVKAGDDISETALVKKIRDKAAEKGIAVPADDSVRRAIVRFTLQDPQLALSKMTRGQLGARDDTPEGENNADVDADGIMFTRVFGGRLLLDHSTLDLIVDHDNVRFRPTVSLLVDDATRLILAHHLIDHIPEPEDFLNILAFASDGYRRMKTKGIQAVPGLHPVLTMRNGLSPVWNELRSLAEIARFKFDIRRAPEPVFGHVLRRSMISKIDTLTLLPRSTMQKPVDRLRPNDVGIPAMPWADAPALLDQAVAAHNRDRLLAVPLTVMRGTGDTIGLRLNTERRDWLEFGLSVFHAEWAAR